jgi:hypothetical protein
MALTQFQKLELNKRVDKILHAPSNAPAAGVQLEISFVADMSSDLEFIGTSIKDAVTSLKAHDKVFQNVRSNMVYWNDGNISTKAVPMTFIQMGKAFSDVKNVDKTPCFDELCEYLKLYGARNRCVLVFMDCEYEELEKRSFNIKDKKRAAEGLNPFLKYRLLIITKDKMIAGSELMLKIINLKEQ